VGDDAAIDFLFADAAGDELGVLSAEIEDEDEFAARGVGHGQFPENSARRAIGNSHGREPVNRFCGHTSPGGAIEVRPGNDLPVAPPGLRHSRGGLNPRACARGYFQTPLRG